MYDGGMLSSALFIKGVLHGPDLERCNNLMVENHEMHLIRTEAGWL